MRRGVTLIELVVAIVVISIAFYSLIAVLTNLLPRDVNAQTLTLGAHLMNEKVENVFMGSYTSIASASATAFPAPFNQYYNQVIVRYVTTAEPNVETASVTKYKKVTVRVWGGQLNTIESVTLAATYEFTQ